MANKIKYKCSFKDSWLQDEPYSSWVEKVDDIHSARCRLCCKTFSIANVGIKASDAHAEGEKHKKRMPCQDSRNRILFQPVEEKDASQSG